MMGTPTRRNRRDWWGNNDVATYSLHDVPEAVLQNAPHPREAALRQRSNRCVTPCTVQWSTCTSSAGVACDHAHTLLGTAYGRNAQAAIKKGHDQAGFQHVRFHGILDSDIGLYNTGGAAYDWTNFDQVYDAIIAAGMHPVMEISFTPPGFASSTTGTAILTNLWYNNVSPNISTPNNWTSWESFMTAIVQHVETRYGAAEVRNNWFFEVWNEPSWMLQGGDGAYDVLYLHTSRGLIAGDSQIRVGGPAGSAGESKPAFNAFRLLHMMGDVTVSTTGGTTSDGVNAVATVSSDGSAVQVLVYNHVAGGTADSSTAKQVSITVNNIPGTGTINVR